ncbi:MAG: regulatory protein GemA [Oscillospiraceae bacterium]|nr:regulatory protein GemA [Oscillospiraceae bacterium]
MTNAQRKIIFGMCKTLGMSEDDRRALIYSVTGSESTKELTDIQTEEVIGELKKRCGTAAAPSEKRNFIVHKPEVADMISNDQKDCAFALLFELKKYDKTPSNASNGARMAGIIRKELKISAIEGDHLWDWVDAKSAWKLIEVLKGYVNSAKKKAERRKNHDKGRMDGSRK